MSTRFVNIDRETPMLLPVNMQDWLPENDLSRFIVDACEQLDTSAFKVNSKGTGSEQMPPTMMLALLIYSYATGTFGSRRIERNTYTDIATIYICGAKAHPDHSVICDFRKDNKEAFEAAFTKVLIMARETGKLKKVGGIAVDGTKIKANASKHSAVSYKRAVEMIKEAEEEVKQLEAKAEEEDNKPLKEGLSVPDEIARRKDRIAALKEAKEAMEKVYQEAQSEKEEGKDKKDDSKGGGSDKPLEEYQHNFTDPESRIMKAGTGKHFEQCYNAQAAVDTQGSMLILAGYVTDHANDKRELEPIVNSVDFSIRRVSAALADTGYFSEKGVTAVEKPDEKGKATGPAVYCAVEKTEHHRSVQDLEQKKEPRLKPNATVKEKMIHRLRTEEGKEIYKKRKETVEPVFGIIKSVMGFRQFLLRGIEKVNTEWTLVRSAYDFKKLHRLIYGETVSFCPVRG